MINTLLSKLNPQRAFWLFAAFTLLICFIAIIKKNNYIYTAPFVILILMFLVAYFKQAYFLLIALLPFSTEYELGNFGTDLPTEPLMVMLMFFTFLYIIAHPQQFSKQFILHPIIVFLLAHVTWIAVAAVFSQIFLVSFKFLLAKIWYITVFTFLTSILIKNEQQFKKVITLLLISLTIIVAYTLIRHANYAFSFADVSLTMRPFFRNHVNYAVMLSILIPYLFYAKNWYTTTVAKTLINIGIVLFVFGIFFSYTRSAYLSLIIIPILKFIFEKRLIKGIVVVVSVLLFLFTVYYSIDNRYLDLAPDYQTTIFHDDFSSHLSATFAGKDISSMERVYRWMAAFNMIKAKFFIGFGPGNFYNFYKSYTITGFATYVSDNNEQSGVHNYFLMTFSEQGIVGFLLFFALVITIFLRGESLYHSIQNPLQKKFAMTLLTSLAIIVFNNLHSDLIESDKVGSLFFIQIAFLVNLDIYHRNAERQRIPKLT